MEKWFTPIQPSVLPAAQKVVVLAPHPDDEIFGCGGAIAWYARQAVAVHAHILTDGAGYLPEQERQHLLETRREESRQALGKLADASAVSCDFGPYQDRSLLQEGTLLDHIKAVLQEHRPGVVFAPSPWEIHPDHQATARATLAAVLHWQRNAGAESPIQLLFYEIGSPLRANFLLDVTDVWPHKEQAMSSFVSQQAMQDYSWHIKGLNAYRTYTLPPEVRYAEAYHYLSATDIQALSENESSAALQPAMQCTDRWLESVLHSASVHAEDLQQALLEQSRHNGRIFENYERLVVQHQQHQHDLQQHYAENLRQHQQALEHHQQIVQQHYQENLQQHQQESLRQQQQLQAELESARNALALLQSSRAVIWARALRSLLPGKRH